jgi:CubicO group peptidase (beta-lactamase class C family)
MTLKRLTRIQLIVTILAFLFVNLTIGQDLPVVKPEEVGFSGKRLERIDEAFTSYVKDNKMAGSVILVSRKGKVAYYKAFGYRDLEAKSAMSKDAIFRIASQTKAIISVGIMILGVQGTLGSVGEFGWGGAYGSTYWVDPAEELVVVYFTQLRPSSIVKDQLMLRNLVYQALEK